MQRMLKRIATILVLMAAASNGLAGPLAHGHAVAGLPTHETPAGAPEVAVMSVAVDHAVDCDGSHEDAPISHQPGGHSHGKTSDKAQLVCSGSSACCASIALADLPISVGATQPGHWTSLPHLLVGRSPPVGERPPHSPYV